MILGDGKDYTLQAVDNGDGGVEYRYVLTANAPEAINPNNLDSVLKAMTGQTYQEFVQAQANKTDPGWGSFARETLSQPAFTIPAAFLGAGAAGAFGEGGVAGLADGVGGYSLGGSSIPAGTTIAGDATNAIAPQFLSGATGGSGAAPGTLAAANASADPLGSLIAGNTANWGLAPGTAAAVGAGGLGGALATGGATAAGSAVLGGSGATGSPDEAAMTQAARDQQLNSLSNPTNGVLNSAASGGSAAALQRILAGNGTAADYGSILGAAAPGLLGAYASDRQTQAYRDLAQQQIGFGAPSRARYEASMQQGFDPASIPGYQAAVDNSMQAMLRKLSTQGSPFGNPGGLIEANKAVIAGTALPAIQNYQNLNSSAGGLNSMAGSGNANLSNAIASQGNAYNSLGAAAANVTAQPQFTLADFMKQFGNQNSNALA